MEYLNFCISDTEQEIIPITVDAIYEVLADNCYQISHHPIPNSFVLVMTLSGAGILNLEEQTVQLQAGDTLLFNADRTFSYQSNDQNWNFWWFEMRILKSDFVEMPTDVVFHLPLDEVQRYLCEEALRRLKLKDSKTACSLLTSLLCLLQKQNGETSDLRRGTELFQQADQYIRRHLASATVESTADYLKVSEHTLLNVFQALFKIKTVTYIHNLKTDMARHLLLTSGMSIKNISEKLGYADQFSFSKSFRKRFGISPTQYRKMMGKQNNCEE